MQLNVRIGEYAIVPMECVRVLVVLAVVMVGLVMRGADGGGDATIGSYKSHAAHRS